MSGQALDLRSTTVTLRRRRGLLSVAGALGLVAGIGFVALLPPQLASTTLVLLPTPTLNRPQVRDVSTQMRIVLSSTLLGKAGEAVTPTMGVRAVEDAVDVSAPTDQLLQIVAVSSKGYQAQALSHAVATAYVNYIRDTATSVSSAALAGLQDRQTKLQAQESGLQKEILNTSARRQQEDPASLLGRRDAQLLAQLRSEQADIALQLDKVKDEISTSAPLAATDSSETSIIQDATPAIGQPLVQRLLLWGPLGFALGALLAAIGVVLSSRRDPRVQLRDDIADAVGSSVLGAVRSHPQRSVAGWSALLETYQAGPVDAWAFRQVLRGLLPLEARGLSRQHDVQVRETWQVDHPRSVTVISLAGDLRGLAVGPQLAAFAASLGISTRLVMGVGHDSAASLWAACTADRQTNPHSRLTVGEANPDDVAELTVVLTVVDRSEPSLGDSLRTKSTLLAVAPSTASVEELARLAVAVDDAGRRIDGIVVADPERADRTTGRHTLDERMRQVALPMRLSGVSSAQPRAGDVRGTRR